MTEEQITAIVRATIEEISTHSPCDFCTSDEGKIRHRKSHEFLDSLEQYASRWEDIKWGVLRDIVKWGTRITLTAIIIGLAIMAAKSGHIK